MNAVNMVKDDDKEAVYHCGFCGFKEENLHEVEEHVSKKHQLEACYFCAVCEKAFKTGAALFKHKEKDHSTSYNRGEEFSKRSTFIQHNKNEHTPAVKGIEDKDQDTEQILDNGVPEVHIEGGVSEKKSAIDYGGMCKQPVIRRSHRKRKLTNRYFSEKIRLLGKSKCEHICTECGNSYKRRQSLLEHMVSHSGQKNISCTSCDATFAWSSSLKVHMETVHNANERQKCPWPECNKAFTRTYYLKLHIRQHTGERPFNCDQCSKTYTQSGHLKEHILTHKTVKPYKCDHCGKDFLRMERLKAHFRTHTGERPYRCDHPGCDKAFMSSDDLRKHRRTHEKGNMQHKCPVCDKGFHRRADLVRHLRTHGILAEDKISSVQKPPRKRVVCDTCGKSLSSPSALTVHRRSHTGERPYLCSQCGKRFTNTSHLKTHMGTHVVDKPYKCDKCPKSFMRPGRLAQHQTFHTGSHNYQCDICGKDFRWNLSYRLHVKHHDDPQPYKCNICSQIFAWPMSYQSHMKRHSGKANFICTKCNRKFAVRRSFTNHLQKPCSAANVYYTCKVCGLVLRYYATMKKHCDIFHRGDMTFDEGVAKETTWRCKICKKILPSRSTLIQHKRENDTCRNGKEYHCRCCRMSFINRGLLNTHYKETLCGNSVLRKGNYKCNQCDRDYSTRGSLNKHMKKHKSVSFGNGEKLPKVGMDSINSLAEITKEIEQRNKTAGPENHITEFEYSMIRTLSKQSFATSEDGIRRWMCALCNVEFTDAVKLREHIGEHIQEKKVLCTVCGKSVLARWKREHQLRHERKFICHICSRQLSCSKTLKDHIRAHSGKKSLQCQHCTKTFTWPSGLRYHMKTHTNDRRHQCPICLKKFIAPYNLKTHMNASHPDKHNMETTKTSTASQNLE